MVTVITVARVLAACYQFYLYFRDRDDKLERLEHLIWFGILMCV